MPIPKNLTKDFFLSFQSPFLLEDWNAAIIDEDYNYEASFSYMDPFIEVFDFYDDYDSFAYGSILYMAPELLNDPIEYNTEIDTFSFGMILYQLFTERKNKQNKKQIKHQISGKNHIKSFYFTETPHFICKKVESHLYFNINE